MGACIHSPPPPPNQIIFITADPAVRIDDIWTAYWIEGVLSAKTSESKLADAAYTLTMSKIELYRPRSNAMSPTPMKRSPITSITG